MIVNRRSDSARPGRHCLSSRPVPGAALRRRPSGGGMSARGWRLRRSGLGRLRGWRGGLRAWKDDSDTRSHQLRGLPPASVAVVVTPWSRPALLAGPEQLMAVMGCGRGSCGNGQRACRRDSQPTPALLGRRSDSARPGRHCRSISPSPLLGRGWDSIAEHQAITD